MHIGKVVRKVIPALAVILLVTISFFAGYGTAIRSANGTAHAGDSQAAPSPEIDQYFQLFWEAWNIIDRDFYDRKALDTQKRTYGAIAGMVEALGDPHSGFSNPQQSAIESSDLRGSFDGIGATLEMLDRYIVIVAPLPDTPAEKAGIRAGDIITEVNGQKTEGLSLNEVVNRIRGPRGSEVELAIVRQGQREPIKFSIVRSEIKLVAVKAEIKAGDIAYVRLTSFTETATKSLIDELKKVLESKPSAIVLDLRNNPGGLLQTSVEISSIFQPKGVVLYEEDKEGKRITFDAQPMSLHTTLPLVVLINRGSASASEIVAGALKDNGRAKLVGQRTFGKGSVQIVRNLSDKSTLRVTIANFFSPNGNKINLVGVDPDVVVDLTEEDRKAGRDPQLDRAIEMAKEAAR
jgi:carboxyl-terminal processing protease